MNSIRLHRKFRQLLLAPATLAATASISFAQTAAPPAAEPPPEETVVLSPFEVKSGTDKGYYGVNTMSGTRFNTKLDDLASSITVMTKGEMADFGMLDANDVFLYVAGTEGTGTYTDFTMDRNGSLSDNVQLNPTGANRVRGIAPANTSLGNIETMGRVPVDPITIDALEISRGPNANVFGLGNPSGTINQVPAMANLTRNRTSVQFRVDGEGGWRTSLDLNQVLFKDKLAIRGSAVYQEDEFERKPSGVRTERFNGMIKYQPFKRTTISGSVFTYHAYGNRPNALPPRDNISYWIAKGKPYWDPVTMTIHSADGSYYNGTQANSTYTATTYNGPDVFYSGYLGNNHNQMFIDRNGMTYWSAPQTTTSATNPTTGLTGQHFLQNSALAGSTFSGTAPRSFEQYLFNTTPTINDRSIYDYTSVNLSAPNRFWDRTVTSMFQIDQNFIDTHMQLLAAQVGFMREDSDRWTRNLIGIANDNGQSGQLTVDINQRLLDGSPNPYFLRPYMAVDKPRIQENPQKWDTSRAQLAYRLDLTEEKNLLSWLGSFQVTGYAEYKYRVNRQYSWREAIAPGTTAWLPAGTYSGFQSSPTGTPTNLALTSGEYRFYVGDNSGNNVDYAPGDVKLGAYNFNWATGATTNPNNISPTLHTESLALSQVAADKTGGALNTKTTIRTKGAVVQNHFLADRVITTLGVRQDDVYFKYGNPGNPTNKILSSDGINFDYGIVNAWQPTYFVNGGRTTNVQIVVRPFKDTPITQRLTSGVLAEFLNGLSLSTNRSNSFTPTAPAQDLFKNRLPNTSGSDKSWGLTFNILKDTLSVRASHYDDFQKNSQTTDINTLAGRVLRIDFVPTGTGNPTPFLNLYNNAVHWVQKDNPSWSADQVAAEVAKKTGFTADDNNYYVNAASTLPIGATSDLRSVGTEIEINYNPTHYWTVSASVTDGKTSQQNISKALVDWINLRMPTWTSVVDTSIDPANAIAEGNPNKLWWLHKYGGLPVPGANAAYSSTAQTPQQNYQAFVGAPLGIIKAQEGKSNPQVRRYGFRGVSSLQLASISDNKYLKATTVGGAFRWEDKAAIGYYGIQNSSGIYTDLDPNRPIYDKAHSYFDAFVTYKTKLWKDKVGASFQINVRNIGQRTRLQPVGVFPDGQVHTYRIMDPQQFIFTASFDL